MNSEKHKKELTVFHIHVFIFTFFNLLSNSFFSQGSGNAITFDGVNDYVDVNSPALTSINNSFTIEFWCFVTNTITIKSQQNGVNDISGTTGNGQRYVVFPTNGLGLGGSFSNAGAGISIGSNAVQIFEHKASYMPCLLSYTCNLSASWNHIALVYINKTPTLYINGVLVKTGLTSNQTNVFPGGDLGNASPLNSTNNLYGPFAGTIDEFRIWNYSRTISDIRNNICKKLTGSEAGLVRYYKFDEPSGSSTCADASANANGTLNNMNTTTCWQTSGASIGDVSVNDYSGAGNWAGKIVSLPITSNGQIASLSTISAPSSTNEPLGIQLYQVNAVPSITTGLSGIGNQNVYFGAYIVNPSNLSQLTNSSTYNFNIDVTGYNPTNNNSTYTRANNTNTFAIGVNNAGTTNYVLTHPLSTNYQNEIIALQTITITSPVSTATYCAGQSLNVTYTVAPSTYSVGNVFPIELSDVTGSFASPVTIGTLSAVNDGTVSCIIPSNTPQGTLYKIRISSSLPVTSHTSSVNFTIIPSVTTAVNASASNVICSGFTTITLTATGANMYSWLPAVGLSATTGSVVIANPIVNTTYTVTGTNSCSSSNAVITVTVQNIVPAAPTPTAFGNGFWNVYCFDNPNYTNYFGYYTENNLNINSQTRWGNTSSPSSANASSGQAYQGCSIANTDYTTISKRTNFICGIYQIDVPAHDDDILIFVDGVQIFDHYGCCDSHSNIWRGFLTSISTVEIRQRNGGGPGYYNVNFTSIGLALSPPVTICAGSSTTLTASPFFSGANYSWSPAASLSSSTGTLVVASPTTGTEYTCTVTNAAGTCSVANSVSITVNPLPTTSVSPASATLSCAFQNPISLVATGANTYSWSPSAGLNATTGASVIATPTITTVYTVTGNNNCASNSATTAITVVPLVSPTVFGNNTWNVYCYNGSNFDQYFGYYTENNLTFSTLNRWSSLSTPSAAISGTMGLGYQGCALSADYHSTIHKRTNFTCGYYQIDIPFHDDGVTVFVNGAQVFQHIYCCDSHANIWTGFLGPTSTVEIRQQEGVGGSGVAASIFTVSTPNFLSPPVTICSGTSTSLTATPFISGATYSWTPSSGLATTTGTHVTASPVTGTNYACTVTDAVSSCSVASSVSITVNPLPTTTVAPTSATISCPSQSITLTVGGANTYTWSPSIGLNTTTGTSVIATPTITTVYTVTGSNNCVTASATTTVTVISPAVFGNNAWNVYCYSGNNFDQYRGYYTENNLSFHTQNRWGVSLSPSSASGGTMGLAYSGCSINNDNHSTIHKRTNLTCGYYQINIPYSDNYATLVIDGIQVFTYQGSTSTGSFNNVWTGFLGPTSTVEIRHQEFGGNSGVAASFILLPLPAPGGVSSGLSLWLKADAGTTGTSSVTTWNDFSGNCMHGTGVNSPSLTINASNYNPGIAFNGASNSNVVTTTSSYFYLPSGFSSFNGATSFLSLNPTTTGVFQRFFDFGNAAASNNIWFGRNSNSTQSCYETFNGGAGGQRIAPAGSLTNNRIQVVTSNHIPITNSVTLQNNAVNYSVGNAQPLQNITRTRNYIGLSNWSADAGFGGLMTEVILYNRSLTNNELQRVNTYLGIKYGVTQNISGMSSAYLSTASSTVFTDGGTYWNNIIGIGRDDAEALYQKQSKTEDDSVRIYTGVLANTNQLNTAIITNTLSYVVVGSNNGYLSMGNNNNEKPIACNLFSRINREWKVMNTNYSNSFSMDIKLNNAAQTSSVNIAHLRLLVDDDGNFATGTTNCYFNGDGTGITISYVAPVITITGISNTHIPNNSTRYITIASTNSATPLPIELVNFEAVYNTLTKHVDLNWQTATQINNDYFTTERSIDGTNWEQVKVIDGAGTNTSYLSYTSIDEKPYTGLSYYRLKQTDFDGAYSYSGIRDVNIDVSTSDKIKIYPNPSSNFITIESLTISFNHIQLINSLGEVVQNIWLDATNTFNLNIASISAGAYIIKVHTMQGDINQMILKK